MTTLCPSRCTITPICPCSGDKETSLIFQMIFRLIFNYFSKTIINIFSQNAKFGSVRPKELFSFVFLFFCFYSSSALNLRLKVFTKLHDSISKSTKSSSFWGGALPSDTPLCKHAVCAGAPMSETHLRPCSQYLFGLSWFLASSLLLTTWLHYFVMPMCV